MSITNQPDKDSETVAPYLPDVTGLSNADAAEEYAKAGCYIVPTRSGDIKNPGSLIGKGWPKRATDDLDTVRQWWNRWPEAGIALHPGPSGFLVFDPDHPQNVPKWLWKHLETALFRPTLTDSDSKRGHYFFSLAEGQRFGCGLGKLNPPKGEKWGEVKCFGGAIILGPTLHPDTLNFHAYHNAPGGNPAFVPDEIAEKLSAPRDPETYRLLTPKELEESAKQFIATYTDEREPYALAPILNNFDPTPNCRHASMYETLCWAMREAKAGRFSAQRALDELKGLWNQSFGIPDD